MKKVLLFVTILTLTSTLFCQARIGYTREQIMNEFYNYTFDFKQLNDSTSCISTTSYDRGHLIYYFNSYGYCYSCALFPNTTGDLNFLVENYNKEYVIISETKWKAYTKKGIVDIELIYGDTFVFFIYK